MDELTTLFSEDKVIEIANTKIKIKQAETQHLPILFAIGEKVAGSIGNAKSDIDIAAQIMGVLSKDFRLVTSLIENLSDIPKDKVGKLNLAASTLIIKNIVEVNIDFLHQHLVPILKDFKVLQEKYRGNEKSKG